jgi:hypothetical protein
MLAIHYSQNGEVVMPASRLTLSILSFIFMGFLASPASAQATRTWVSGVGDDANPCSRTAPCKTFAGAISKTAPSGEINVLDPGGFGAVTITKSITIRSDHIEAGVLVAGTNGIIISAAATDRVVLEGLDFEGTGTGLDGVRVNSAGKVFVIRCRIQNFANNGITMTSTGAHLFVNDSFIITNGLTSGVFGGIDVAGVSNIASITNTSILSNGTGATGFAVNASTASAIIGVQNSVLNDSPNGISRVAGAQVISVGPSNLVTGAGTFTSMSAFQ